MKKYFTFTFIIIATLLTSCMNRQFNTATPTIVSIATVSLCRPEIETVTIPISDTRSYPEITEAIFSNWLRQQVENCPRSSIYGLEDFKIDGVSQYTDSPPFYIGVYYSVKPTQVPSIFTPGNGSFDEETGWILGKVECFELVVGDTEYQLTGGWTLC